MSDPKKLVLSRARGGRILHWRLESLKPSKALCGFKPKDAYRSGWSYSTSGFTKVCLGCEAKKPKEEGEVQFFDDFD